MTDMGKKVLEPFEGNILVNIVIDCQGRDIRAVLNMVVHALGERCHLVMPTAAHNTE